jgi:hypothetical protein
MCDLNIGDMVTIPKGYREAKFMCENNAAVGWASHMVNSLNKDLRVTQVDLTANRCKLSDGYWWPIRVCVSGTPFRKQLKGESDTQYRVCRKVIKMEKQHASRNISV